MEKPELRVLQIFSNLGMGGAETWLLALLRHFQSAAAELPVRVKTHVLLTHGRPDALDAEACALGATLHYLPYTRRTLPRFACGFRRLLRDGDFHAIHDHQENTAGIHLLMGLGRLPSVRVVHLHNPLTHLQRYSSSALRRFTLWLGRDLIARLATHIAGTSWQLIAEQGFMADKFRRQTREAVHCGFDAARFAGDHQDQLRSVCAEFGFPADARLMLFVGRLDSHPDERMNQKNPVFALEVARACAEQDARFRLLLAGGGDAVRARLNEQVRAWGLAGRIRLIGQRTDVPRLMLGSHLFLLPSIAEGLGMVAVEAQATGLPCLISDVTPRECVVVPELVRFLPLAAGTAAWAREALARLDAPRPCSSSSNLTVRSSPFAIEQSAAHLLRYYRTAPPIDPVPC